MIPLQEKLRSRFLRAVLRLGAFYEDQGRFREASRHYERGLDIDPQVEEFYQRRMHCLQQQGQTAEAVALYKRCCNTLEKVFGVSPSQKTQTIYRGLLKKR